MFTVFTLFFNLHLRLQVSTNSVAPSSLYKLTQPTTLPIAPTKCQRSKRQLISFELSMVVKFKLSTPQLINPILTLKCHAEAFVYKIAKPGWFLSYSDNLLFSEIMPIVFLTNSCSSPLYFSKAQWCGIGCWNWIDPAQILHF